jgi:hypothetical protein
MAHSMQNQDQATQILPAPQAEIPNTEILRAMVLSIKPRGPDIL